MPELYYVKKLREDYSRRNRINKSFSLRAYARYIGMHPSTLSQVLLGKRPLPRNAEDAVISCLNLNPKERSLFKQSLDRRKGKLDSIRIKNNEDQFLLDEAYFQIIAEWEHYAVLTLFDCDDFEPDPDYLQRRLNISKSRVDVVLSNLLKFGLLKCNEQKKLMKAHAQVCTTEDITSQALRASHLETLHLGQQKLESIPLEQRDFSSAMFAINEDRIEEAKQIIREFRKKMMALYKDGPKSSVYQLAIQFYPMTVITNEKEKL